MTICWVWWYRGARVSWRDAANFHKLHLCFSVRGPEGSFVGSGCGRMGMGADREGFAAQESASFVARIGCCLLSV